VLNIGPLGKGPVMKKIRNACLEYRCVKCCSNTEMLLSSSDILRIRGLGFSEDFFIVRRTGTGSSRTCQGDASFITVRDVPSTIIDLRVVGCTRPFSMMTREKQISIHTAHITESFDWRPAFHVKSFNSSENWMWKRRDDSDSGNAELPNPQ